MRVHDHVDANALLVEREIFLLNDQSRNTLLPVTRTETNKEFDTNHYLERTETRRHLRREFSTQKIIHLEATLKLSTSGGELLEIRLIDNHLLDTFGRKSTARHKIYHLLESS